MLELIKTMSFGLTHVAVAFTVVYLLTGDAAVGGMAAIIEPACNTVAYHFHEKVWNRFQRSRQRPLPCHQNA